MISFSYTSNLIDIIKGVILKEGFCYKKAADTGKTRLFDSWKKRYFVLMETKVLYAAAREDVYAKGGIKGSFELTRTTKVVKSETESGAFNIINDNAEGGEQLRLKCDHHSDSSMWMTSISKAVSQLNA